METPKKVKTRISEYGFYCGNCNKFVYQGYGRKDKIGLPQDNAVCLECGDNYEDLEDLNK